MCHDSLTGGGNHPKQNQSQPYDHMTHSCIQLLIHTSDMTHSQVVAMIKNNTKPKPMTLSIGDGANDGSLSFRLSLFLHFSHMSLSMCFIEMVWVIIEIVCFAEIACLCLSYITVDVIHHCLCHMSLSTSF